MVGDSKAVILLSHLWPSQNLSSLSLSLSLSDSALPTLWQLALQAHDPFKVIGEREGRMDGCVFLVLMPVDRAFAPVVIVVVSLAPF